MSFAVRVQQGRYFQFWKTLRYGPNFPAMVRKPLLALFEDPKCRRQFLPGRSKIEVPLEAVCGSFVGGLEGLSMQNWRMLNNIPEVVPAVRNVLKRALPRKAFLFVLFV